MDRNWIIGILFILVTPFLSAQDLVFRADTVNLTEQDLVSEKCVQIGIYMTNTSNKATSWAQVTATLLYQDNAGILSGTPFVTATDFGDTPNGAITDPGQINMNMAGTSTSCAPVNIVNVATRNAGPEASLAVGSQAASLVSEQLNLQTGRINISILNFTTNNFSLPPNADVLFAIVEFPVAQIVDREVDGFAGFNGLEVSFVPNSTVPDGNIVTDGVNTRRASFVNGGVGVSQGGNAADRVGLFRPSNNAFFLDVDGNNAINFPGDTVAFMGAAGDLPVTGKWNADANDKLGLRRTSGIARFFLDVNGSNSFQIPPDQIVFMGSANDVPLVGNWSGGNSDSLGLFRPSTNQFFLDVTGDGSIGAGDAIFGMGAAGDIPLVGDWNGDGTDEVGLFRPSTNVFFLDVNNSRNIGAGDAIFGMGAQGDLPLIGDWNGDGTDHVGLFRPSINAFFLDTNNSRSIGAGDAIFGIGATGDIPIVGKW